MKSSAELVGLALQNVGKLCSVHFNTIDGAISFEWARICKTQIKEAEMFWSDFETAAMLDTDALPWRLPAIDLITKII